MKEFVFIIWGVLAVITALVMTFLFKRYDRSLGRYAGFQKIGLSLLVLGVSWLLFRFLLGSPHLIWASRLAILSLAAIHLWVTYLLKFSERSTEGFMDDSILPEYLYLQLHALIAAMIFVAGPQVLGLVDMQTIDLSKSYWDLPLLFLLPFAVLKLTDFASYVPYRQVESRWLYPLETVHIDERKWVDLVQVNFQLRDGIRREYRFFGSEEYPWIQVPRAMTLGDAFRLTMQERRKHKDLKIINDLGNEHGGTPHFWWLFRRKRIWWHPLTWFTRPRYLNPDHSLEANRLREYDTVILRRIPAEDDFISGIPLSAPVGGDDTIILQRQ